RVFLVLLQQQIYTGPNTYGNDKDKRNNHFGGTDVVLHGTDEGTGECAG
ncbi:hypothetical protein PvtlMGM1_0722, partial [Prevotella sp. MGM1]